ncbi:MAG: hypothetical protein F6K42_19320 [Leptolyngbya sp. SIO1D8]|nr:hypothetical protein [Leptolyngbya sp. SIO1D8]
MTKTSKFLLVGIGTLLAIVISSGIYLAVGATVFGPKTEVSEACSSIKDTKPPSATEEIVSRYKGMDFMFTDDSDWVQVSKVFGGWICFCHANLENGSADDFQVTDVYCSD